MNNRQNRFAMRMAVLLLCLLVFAAALSSCGYFTDQFLAEYVGTYYDPGDLTFSDITLRVPGQTHSGPFLTRSPETTRTPTTTRVPETTRKPTTTKAPETTRAPQTTVPVTTDNIPDEFQNHVFLDMKDSGRCDELVGNVLVTVIIVSDSESSWSINETTALKKSLYEQEQVLESEAAKYGKKLDITFSYIKATHKGKISSGDEPESWQDPICVSVGFSSLNKAQTELDNSNDADSNPIAFLINKPGRPYASWNTSTARTERLTLFSSDLDSFSHELCHLYGAQDYYYPEEVKNLADKYMPNSIMNSGDKIDCFTAFCIGWDEKIDEDAYDFLAATAHMTDEYLNSENEKQQTTGNVTNFKLSYGIYTGYLDRGVPNGKGSINYDNGNSYEGYFSNGLQHGRGVFRWADGIVYDGDWVNGNKTGKGTMTWADGAVYSGDWVDNERTGKGVLIWAGGEKYEGDFVNGSRTGKGKYTWTNGAVYEGDFVDGAREGQGYYVTTDGYTYSGGWKNNQYHGYGRAKYTDGGVYEGYFKEGSRHGQGTYTYPSGHKYTGEWADGSRTGYGYMTWSDGSSYEGYWQNNKRHGYGKYINQYGTVFEGNWKNDQFQS